MTSTSWPDGDRLADVADLAGLSVGPLHAVQALGEDPGHRGLADAAGPAEQVGLGEPVQPDRVPQGLDDVVLADDVLEPLRAVAPGDDRVRRRGSGRAGGEAASARQLRASGSDLRRGRLLDAGLLSGRRRRSARAACRRQVAGATRRRSACRTVLLIRGVRPRRRAPPCRGRRGRVSTRHDIPRRGPGEPGRFSQAHEGVAYGCCVPALTRFTNPHCPGPPRLTRTPAGRAGMSP